MQQYSNYTDDELLIFLQDNNEQAYNEIYYRYWKLMYSVAAGKLQNAVDAEEVVQDIFTDLWRRRKEICINYSLKSYLAGAVKNGVYTALSKQYRKLKMEQTLQEKERTSVNAVSIEDEMYVKRLEKSISEAAERLPDRCRLVYQLSRDKGLSNKQIAKSLQISEKTVENQITRALRQLRNAIQGFISLF